MDSENMKGILWQLLPLARTYVGESNSEPSIEMLFDQSA